MSRIEALIGTDSNMKLLEQIFEELALECDRDLDALTTSHLSILHAIMSNYVRYPYAELYAMLSRWSAEHGPCVLPFLKTSLQKAEALMHMITHNSSQAIVHIYMSTLGTIDTFCSNPTMPKPTFICTVGVNALATSTFARLHQTVHTPVWPHTMPGGPSTRPLMLLHTVARLLDLAHLDVCYLSIPTLRASFFRVTTEDCVAHQRIGPTFHHHDALIQPVIYALQHVLDQLRTIDFETTPRSHIRIALNKTGPLSRKQSRTQLISTFQRIESRYNTEYKLTDKDVYYLSTRTDRMPSRTPSRSQVHVREGAGLHILSSAYTRLNTFLLRALRMARYTPHEFFHDWCSSHTALAPKRARDQR